MLILKQEFQKKKASILLYRAWKQKRVANYKIEIVQKLKKKKWINSQVKLLEKRSEYDNSLYNIHIDVYFMRKIHITSIMNWH